MGKDLKLYHESEIARYLRDDPDSALRSHLKYFEFNHDPLNLTAFWKIKDSMLEDPNKFFSSLYFHLRNDKLVRQPAVLLKYIEIDTVQQFSQIDLAFPLAHYESQGSDFFLIEKDLTVNYWKVMTGEGSSIMCFSNMTDSERIKTMISRTSRSHLQLVKSEKISE